MTLNTFAPADAPDGTYHMHNGAYFYIRDNDVCKCTKICKDPMDNWGK